MTRFELATPRPPDVCATGLRYIPKTKGCKYKRESKISGYIAQNFRAAT